MIIFNKIKLLYMNIAFIFGSNYSYRQSYWVLASSILLIPIYVLFITILSVISILQMFLFSPFYLAKIIMNDTWGLDDPILGLVMLPLFLSYYGFFLITFLPYLILGALADLLAEIISKNNHHPLYVIVWPSVFATPHKEAEHNLYG